MFLAASPSRPGPQPRPFRPKKLPGKFDSTITGMTQPDLRHRRSGWASRTLSNLPGSSVGRKRRSVGAPAPRPAVRSLFVAATLALLLCSACQVTIAAGIDANADGSGVVRAGVGLDEDALR